MVVLLGCSYLKAVASDNYHNINIVERRAGGCYKVLALLESVVVLK